MNVLDELKQQAEQGEGGAANKLGEAYREGEGVRKNFKQALHWYQRGAELGDACAQNNLGSMLLNGIGTKKNPAAAMEWYRKSAEQGLAVAQYNLGKRYLCGDGVDQDYAEARNWFEKAAVQGNSWSACELGTMHELGQGVEANLVAAAEFHLIAAEAGDEYGWLNLGKYRTDLEQLALAGDPIACFFLCRMSNRGFGAEKSQAMTWAWISLAKKFTTADTDPQIAVDVKEAYDFYRMTISAENRKEGQKALAAKKVRKPSRAGRGT